MARDRDLEPKRRTFSSYERKVRRVAGKKGSRSYAVITKEGEKVVSAITPRRGEDRRPRAWIAVTTDRHPSTSQNGQKNYLRTKVVVYKSEKSRTGRDASIETGLAQPDSTINIQAEPYSPLVGLRRKIPGEGLITDADLRNTIRLLKRTKRKNEFDLLHKTTRKERRVARRDDRRPRF